MPSVVTGGMRAVEESAERPGLKAGKVCCVTRQSRRGAGLGCAGWGGAPWVVGGWGGAACVQGFGEKCWSCLQGARILSKEVVG